MQDTNHVIYLILFPHKFLFGSTLNDPIHGPKYSLKGLLPNSIGLIISKTFPFQNRSIRSLVSYDKYNFKNVQLPIKDECCIITNHQFSSCQLIVFRLLVFNWLISPLHQDRASSLIYCSGFKIHKKLFDTSFFKR